MKLAQLLEIALDDRKHVLGLQAELVELDQGFGCELQPVEGSDYIDVTITREETDFTLKFTDAWSHDVKWIANWFCMSEFKELIKGKHKVDGFNFKFVSFCRTPSADNIIIEVKKFAMPWPFTVHCELELHHDSREFVALVLSKDGGDEPEFIDFMRPEEITAMLIKLIGKRKR